MAPTRITIALNTNQSQRAPLLIPPSACTDPHSPTSLRNLVFKAACSKLRIKKPSRIFIAGSGAELIHEDDWKRGIRNDVSLLISAGEEYVGVNRDAGIHAEANPNCPVHVLADAAAVDKLSIDQLETTARTLPGLVHAVGQPDIHPGTKFPIGFGSSILKKYTSGGQVSLKEDSAEAREYLEEHDRACRWAKANRDLIALRFLSCLEPGEPVWSLGKNDADVAEVHDVIPCAKAELCARRVVDIWHNNVDRVKWPPTSPATSTAEETAFGATASTSSQRHAYIHRKGAAPTQDPSTSLPLPILPLPGSRGTPTLILTPQLGPSTSYGLTNALSLAHGAGRSMSRAKALSTLSHKYKASSLLEPRGGTGTWVVCESKDLVFEEAPEAYKDVEAVGEDLPKQTRISLPTVQ
ncbi:uncharacterized protein N0V89_006131 [Didymosphaeria variabile]|uniref:3'-phosphate/5'-hydroxy nucleic acid ligase n=1 Tax=Didymosphaeria variabile TaxID=1932322 RepID=A0A9W9CBX4_9PLEO|nr:uncharacterized protein N0V89_006131 [Didymosphaeria variabile]KAJ4354395.1 hypothetical protein N0V89_006131 [Didymosphaeria variabile]